MPVFTPYPGNYTTPSGVNGGLIHADGLGPGSFSSAVELEELAVARAARGYIREPATFHNYWPGIAYIYDFGTSSIGSQYGTTGPLLVHDVHWLLCIGNSSQREIGFFIEYGTIVLEPATTYTMSMWMRSQTNGRPTDAQFGIDLLATDDAEIYDEQFLFGRDTRNNPTNDPAWTFHHWQFTTQDLGLPVAARPYWSGRNRNGGSANGQRVDISCPMIHEGTQPVYYFDGAYLGEPDGIYAVRTDA